MYICEESFFFKDDMLLIFLSLSLFPIQAYRLSNTRKLHHKLCLSDGPFDDEIKKINILCLHGYLGNGIGMSISFGALIEESASFANFGNIYLKSWRYYLPIVTI